MDRHPAVSAPHRYVSAFSMPLVLALVAASLCVALVSAQQSLILLCALVLLTAAVAKLWSLFSLSRLSCELHLDKQRMFPGETLRVDALVANAKLLPIWVQVQVPIGNPARSHAAAQKLLSDTGLLSHQRVRLRWHVTKLERGVYRMGEVTLTASDPLGFFPTSKLSGARELIVYPRLVPLLGLQPPMRELLGQTSPQSPIEDPTYVHGVREYRGARAARHIHWKASARVHQLVEKLFERCAQPRVMLVLRAEGFAHETSRVVFEHALEALASLAVELDRQRVATGLVTNCALSGRQAPLARVGRGLGQLARLLEILARVQPRVDGADGDLERAVRGACSAAAQTAFVVFCYASDAELVGLGSGRERQTVRVVCGPQAAAPDTSVSLRPRHYRLSDLRAHVDARHADNAVVLARG